MVEDEQPWILVGTEDPVAVLREFLTRAGLELVGEKPAEAYLMHPDDVRKLTSSHVFASNVEELTIKSILGIPLRTSVHAERGRVVPLPHFLPPVGHNYVLPVWSRMLDADFRLHLIYDESPG